MSLAPPLLNTIPNKGKGKGTLMDINRPHLVQKLKVVCPDGYAYPTPA